jgi:hypothetical protein
MANTTSINSELFQNLLVQSQYALYENSIARAVSRVFDYPVGAGKSVSVPIWAGITSSKPGEGTAPSAADTNTNAKAINLEEHVVYAQVTDFLRDSAQEDVIAALANQSGSALAEGLDKELLGLFTDASVTQTVGTAGANNTVEDLFRAASLIRSQKWGGQIYAVIHPKQAFEIKKALTATTAYTANTNVGNAVLDQYTIGNIAGITVLEHPLLTIDASEDSYGCVFAPEAFGIAQRGGVQMGTQRQEKERATDVVMSVTAGAGILRPELAVQFIGDAAI